jgi:hypothetical protein
MLDRSQTANLFSENLDPPDSETTHAAPSLTRDGPPPASAAPTRPPIRASRREQPPRLRRAARSAARSRSNARPPKRKRKRVEAQREPWNWRERLPPARLVWRRAQRYVPVGVLLVILLTNPVGCGRHATTSPATSTPSRPSSSPSAAHSTPNLPDTQHFARPRARPARSLSGRSAQVVQAGPAPQRAAVSESAAPRAAPTAAAPGPVGEPASPSTSPSISGKPPPDEGGAGDEFGFER